MTNYRQRLLNAVDRFQTVNVTCVEVRGRGGHLHRARPHKDQLGAHVGSASLQVV
jgi:hypothetical protein